MGQNNGSHICLIMGLNFLFIPHSLYDTKITMAVMLLVSYFIVGLRWKSLGGIGYAILRIWVLKRLSSLIPRIKITGTQKSTKRFFHYLGANRRIVLPNLFSSLSIYLLMAVLRLIINIFQLIYTGLQSRKTIQKQLSSVVVLIKKNITKVNS